VVCVAEAVRDVFVAIIILKTVTATFPDTEAALAVLPP
jgi:hypothetical protein